MDSESTDRTARRSVALVSWIAHAFCHRFLVLAGRVGVADIHFQAGYLCMKKKKKSYRCVINVPSHCSHDLDFFLENEIIEHKSIGKRDYDTLHVNGDDSWLSR